MTISIDYSEMTMDKIKNMAINHIMRNIDLKLFKEPNYNFLFTNESKEELVYLLIAASLRSVRDTIHVYFCEDSEVLQPLPLSISSFCMATAEEYQLLKDYRIDEEEDVHMELDLEQCRGFLKEVCSFIEINAESLTTQLLYQQNRDCEFTIVSNS